MNIRWLRFRALVVLALTGMLMTPGISLRAGQQQKQGKSSPHKSAPITHTSVPEPALDSAFRPERYTQRLGPVFERLARLS